MSDRKELGIRILGELVIIVAGVLIAFQVESWREAAESRQREQAQLAALRADFEENVERLEDVEWFQRRALRAYGEVLAIGNGDASMPATDSASYRLFRLVRQFGRFEPVTGAYDAMVSSGDLRLLRNPELRAELAGFLGAAGDGYEDEGLAELLRAEFMLIGARTIPMAWIRFGFGDVPFSPEAVENERVDPEVDFGALFTDPNYLGLLVELGQIEARVLGYFEDLHERAERILTLVEEELHDDRPAP